jgi:phosphate-selective porin OprO and OprP
MIGAVKMSLKTAFSSSALTCAVALVGSHAAFAQQSHAAPDAAAKAQIEALAEQIQALQGQLTQLKDAVAKESAATNKRIADLPTVTADGGRIRVRTADKKFDAAIRSRIHMDYGFFTNGDNFNLDATDGFQVRRAFLGVAGSVFKDWGYEFTANFADNRGGGSQIQAANITYNGFANTSLIAGVFQPKFTLDDSTSSNDIPFMERSPVGNIVVGIGGSDSRTGVGASYKGEKYFAAAYLTGNSTGTTGTIDDQVNILGRLAYQMLSSTEGAMGIGISGVYQATPQAAARPTPTPATFASTSIAFGDRSAARIGGNRTQLMSTGTISEIDSAYAYGYDVGFNYKNFWAAGEYYAFGAETAARLKGGNANPIVDPEFDGYYLSAGYILTGERRSYGVGEWSGVRPAWPVGQNGVGAWEVAIRYAHLDLIDAAANVGRTAVTAANGANSGPGIEDIVTLGVNWYINPAIRLMFNYNIVDIERPGGIDVGTDIVAMRLQFQF